VSSPNNEWGPKEELRGEPSKEGHSSSLSNIKVKSKHSEHSNEGESKRLPRTYRLTEEDRVL
jgi:hypothetical protein